METDAVIHLASPKGKYYSFPSNHAANIAGLATIFTFIYYNYKYYFWIIAIIVMFSRIYIGVHYPSDVITGWAIGFLYGFLLIKCWIFFENKQYENQVN